MNGGQAIAQILKSEGVEHVFCFPFTPILDSLAEVGMRPIVARQERVAENMADGFSRIHNGKKIGVVTVQQSAGAENAFAGIAQANTDSSPILFLPGHPGRDAVGARAEEQGRCRPLRGQVQHRRGGGPDHHGR